MSDDTFFLVFVLPLVTLAFLVLVCHYLKMTYSKSHCGRYSAPEVRRYGRCPDHASIAECKAAALPYRDHSDYNPEWTP